MNKQSKAFYSLIAIAAIIGCIAIANITGTQASTIESYLDNVDFNQITPFDRGSLAIYEGNILTTRNQCQSILDAAKDKSAVDIAGRDLRTIYRNAVNLDYMDIQNRYSSLNAAWDNYANETLRGYESLGSRITQNAENAPNNVDVEGIYSLINACQTFETNISGFVSSFYDAELGDKSDVFRLSTTSQSSYNSAIQVSYEQLPKSELPTDANIIQEFKVKDNIAYFRYGNSISPVYIENNRLKLVLNDGLDIKQDEDNPSRLEVFYLTY